jgi:hypothetical protein
VVALHVVSDKEEVKGGDSDNKVVRQWIRNYSDATAIQVVQGFLCKGLGAALDEVSDFGVDLAWSRRCGRVFTRPEADE